MDKKLSEYLEKLREDYNFLTFPDFSHRYSSDINKKKILVLLKSPGKSGVKAIKECCILNQDPTSKNQRIVILEELKIPPLDILFWNFYPFHVPSDVEIQKDCVNPERWAKELQNLLQIMDNLQLIVLSGKGLFDGMRFVDPTYVEPLVWTPSPAPQVFNHKENQKIYRKRWKKVERFVYPTQNTKCTFGSRFCRLLNFLQPKTTD